MAVSFNILPISGKKKKGGGKAEGQKHVPAESSPLMSFPTTPSRDFCLCLTKHSWDSGDTGVFNRLHCFWNKIGVFFIRIGERQDWHIAVSCYSMAAFVARSQGAIVLRVMVVPPHLWVIQSTVLGFCLPFSLFTHSLSYFSLPLN